MLLNLGFYIYHLYLLCVGLHTLDPERVRQGRPNRHRMGYIHTRQSEGKHQNQKRKRRS